MHKNTQPQVGKAAPHKPKVGRPPAKRNFKVRTKPKTNPASEKELAAPVGGPDQASSTSANATRLIKHVGATGLPATAVRYEVVCGAARPVAKAIASDLVAIEELKKSLAADLRDYAAQGPIRIGIQVSRMCVQNGAAVNISIGDVKKGGSLYDKSKADGISTLRFCPVPQVGSAVPGIAVDLVTLLMSSDANRPVYGSTRRCRKPDNFDRSLTTRWDSDEPDGVETALGMMFPAVLHQLPPTDPTVDETSRFDSHCKPGDRALLTLMCRSQVLLSKMMISHGLGKGMIKRALTNVETLMAGRCKGVQPIMSEEEIIHFWFAEIRRLELDDISVPIIRLH